MLSWGSAWKAVKNGVTSGGKAVAGFVKAHQSEIAGFVVGAAVMSGCMAATWGVGSVGCAALAGAAGGAVTNLWRTQVQKTASFSWTSLAVETGVGALLGAAGGAAGKLVTKTPGVTTAVTSASKAIKGAASRVATAVSRRGGGAAASEAAAAGRGAAASAESGAASSAGRPVGSNGSPSTAMDSYLAEGATVRHTPTATAIGDDAATLTNFGRSQGTGGMHDVILHGTLDGRPWINGSVTGTGQIATAILENPNYVAGQSIRLVMCHDGREAAADLSQILGVDVLATTRQAQLDPFTGLLLQGRFS